MRPSISEHFRQHLIPKVRAEILRESDAQILGSDADELKAYYFDKYAWLPLEEDPQREASFDFQNYLKTIPAHEREREYSAQGDLRDFECQRVVVEVPILPNKNLREIAELSGDSYSLSYSDTDFRWEGTSVSFTLETKGYAFNFSEDQIASGVEQAIRRIRETIGVKNRTITAQNINLSQAIVQMIAERKNKISDDKARVSELTKRISIPLKKKPAVGAQAIPLAQRPLVQRIKPKAVQPEEYVLDKRRTEDVIEFLDGQAKNFERTPKAIKNLGEEDLRDLLLANLNSIFQGDATGETFSKNGKTDIYLKIDRGSILVCECKIWGGRALFEKAINQLRGYLTWRHNYGIVINFVRSKGFTRVLAESSAAIQEHASYLNGFKRLGDSHFVSNHKVDDDEKEVCIHHLFYHLALDN
jgi:hypothetical protein